MIRKSTPPEVRFWKKVTKQESGCWTWNAAVDKRGYGIFGVGAGDVRFAHRYSFEMKNGLIPDGLLICHRCDNPPCVNPDHLFTGTAFDNLHDGISKGRIRIWEHPKRQVLCRAGHVLAGDNVISNGFYKGKHGIKQKRTCAICQKAMRDRLRSF